MIIFVGAPGYRYFGAPSLALRAEQGSHAPALITAALTLVFTLWGAYALSGGGILAPFPFLRSVLTVITAIYLVRGLLIIPVLIQSGLGGRYIVRQLAFSAVPLAIGAAHALGLWARGRRERGV